MPRGKKSKGGKKTKEDVQQKQRRVDSMVPAALPKKKGSYHARDEQRKSKSLQSRKKRSEVNRAAREAAKATAAASGAGAGEAT